MRPRPLSCGLKFPRITGYTMKKICVLAAALLSLHAFADNDQGFYAGVGGAIIDDQQDGIDNLSHIKAQEIFGGYKYNEFLGVELRFGSGRTAGTTSYNTTYVDQDGKVDPAKRHFYSIEREINHYTSIYYKPELVNEEAKLYALLGYTSVSTEGGTVDNVKSSGDKGWNLVSSTTKRDSGSKSGFSYGLGVGFILNEHFNVNIEYRNISNGISGKPNLLGVNVDYRF